MMFGRDRIDVAKMAKSSSAKATRMPKKIVSASSRR